MRNQELMAEIEAEARLQALENIAVISAAMFVALGDRASPGFSDKFDREIRNAAEKATVDGLSPEWSDLFASEHESALLKLLDRIKSQSKTFRNDG
jgi:hypothetical protein